MTIAPHLLESYQTLLGYSQTMLRLANEGNWDALIAVEIDYAKTVEKLAASTRDNPLPMAMLEQLRPVLRHLLDNERELKVLLKQRQDELSQIINQSGRQQTLMSTYAKNAGLVMVPRDI